MCMIMDMFSKLYIVTFSKLRMFYLTDNPQVCYPCVTIWNSHSPPFQLLHRRATICRIPNIITRMVTLGTIDLNLINLHASGTNCVAKILVVFVMLAQLLTQYTGSKLLSNAMLNNTMSMVSILQLIIKMCSTCIHHKNSQLSITNHAHPAPRNSKRLKKPPSQLDSNTLPMLNITLIFTILVCTMNGEKRIVTNSSIVRYKRQGVVQKLSRSTAPIASVSLPTQVLKRTKAQGKWQLATLIDTNV